MKTESGISKTITKKDGSVVHQLPTGFAGEHIFPANLSYVEEDQALQKMTSEIESQIASGTLSRAQIRLLRNRLSAARSRFRKRHFLGVLETQVNKLEAEKEELSVELERQKQATDKAARDAAHLRQVLATLMPEGPSPLTVTDVSKASAVAPMTSFNASSSSPVALAAPSAVTTSPLMANVPALSLGSAAAIVGADSSPVAALSPSGSPAPLAPRAGFANPSAPKAPDSPILDFLLADWANTTSAPTEVKQEDAVLPGTGSPSAQEDTAAWLNAYLGPASTF